MIQKYEGKSAYEIIFMLPSFCLIFLMSYLKYKILYVLYQEMYLKYKNMDLLALPQDLEI